MQEVTKYPHATFSWVDLNTTDAAGGKAFYTALFGWTFEDQPTGMGVDYTMFFLNGKSVAALSPMMPDMQEQGVPPTWNSYITVDDLEATTEKAEQAGAKVVMPPMDVLDAGRMSMIQDPTGGHVAFWSPGNHIGASLVNIPNTFVWNELATRDPEDAAQFYNTVLGWETQADSGPNPYTMFVNNGRFAGGLLGMDDSFGDMPTCWSVYFSVEDLDASVARVKELGGNILVESQNISETDRFAVVQDPQGAVFNLMYMVNVDPMP